MGADLAKLGTYDKSNKKNKVYYVNRLEYGFSVPKVDEKGKSIQRTNLATGLPITNGRGEPEYFEETVMFKRWQPRFLDLGYWSVYEVTPNTPKIIANTLEKMAKSRNHQVMTEKAFIDYTNPELGKYIAENADIEAERQMLTEDVEKAKEEKTRLEKEIERLKQKTGVK